MKDLVTYIVQAIVEKPEEVSIEETVLADGKIILTIHTAPTDVGLVIGKMGKTINAIRSLVKIKAIKEGKFVDVKVPSDRDNGPTTSAPQADNTSAAPAPAPTADPVADSAAVTGEFDVPNF
ncbi:MAG: KH domain-containing protein [Candidatus Dojkabacteria bacterium]|nr:MAG: KH domain-containing protein [Candidatus Dojkabacteria bacterium]